MPSIGALLGKAFGFASKVDVIADVGNLARGATTAITGGSDEMMLKKVRRTSAAVLDITSAFIILNDDADRKAFLADQLALKCVTEVYYGSLTPEERDEFEKLLGEVWGVICEGMGVRRPVAPPPQQGQRGQGQQPRGQHPPSNPLREISEVDLFLAVRICLGKEALAATDTDAGDVMIKNGLDRLRQATLGEKAVATAKKGAGVFAETLNMITDELERQEEML